MSADRSVREYVVVLLSLAVLIYFISKGMFLFALSSILLIVFFRLLPDTSLAFLLIFAIGALEVKLPFYPNNMPNELPFIVWYTAVALATFTIKKPTHVKHRLTSVQRSSFFILIFTLILLAIARDAFASNVNLSTLWYGVIALSALIFIISRDERLSVKRMNGLVFCILGATFIKAFIQSTIILTGTRFMWVERFIDVSAESSISDSAFGQRYLIKRFSTLNEVASSLAFLAFRYLKLNRIVFAYLVFALAFACAALSSYRYGVLMIIICFGIYVILFLKRKVHTLFMAFLLAILGCALLYAVAPVLPFQMQRGISFLPGIKIPYLAKASASGTIGWRIDLWKYTLGHIKEYLLVGRGLTRDYTSALALNTFQQSKDYYILCYHLHSYHSSLLGLFMDLGIIGATSFIVFVTATLRQLYRGIKELTQKTFLVIFLQYYFCFYIARLVVSSTSGFNIDEMIYDTFINLSLIHVLTNSLIDAQSDKGVTS